MVMKRTRWFRQPKSDYVSELPQYHRPSMKEIGLHVWDRLWDYLQKIGTVILWASVIIWALTYFPTGSMDLEHSYLAAIGQWTEPVMRPLGFDWKMSVCLLTGLPAKEAIISTMGILYGGDAALRLHALRAALFPLYRYDRYAAPRGRNGLGAVYRRT